MRLKEIREKAGKTQEEVAADLGWNTASLSRIENGKQNTKLSVLETLARYYKVEPPVLFEYNGPNPLKRLAWTLPDEHAALAADLLGTYERHLRLRSRPE